MQQGSRVLEAFFGYVQVAVSGHQKIAAHRIGVTGHQNGCRSLEIVNNITKRHAVKQRAATGVQYNRNLQYSPEKVPFGFSLNF